MNINNLFQDLQDSKIPFGDVTINKPNRSIKLIIFTSNSEARNNANNIVIKHLKTMNDYSLEVACEIKE